MSDESPDILDLLEAAEEALYSQDDPAGAIEACDQALEQVTDEADFLELILLKAEAEIAAELDGFAARTLAELDSSTIDDARVWCDIGQLWWAIGDDDRTEDAYARALELDDGLADAHYGAALIHESRGEAKAMVHEFLRTLELDAVAPHADPHVSEESLQSIAENALAELPPRALELLENVPILVEELPARHLVEEGLDPRILGLFSGRPLTEVDSAGGQVPGVDTIHLYQRNLERGVADEGELADEIRITVLHETAHFFGLEDDDLDALGLG